MAWKVQMKFTRPNTGVAWYQNATPSDSAIASRKSNYIDTGKIISTSQTVSANGLVLTKEIIYKDEASREEHFAAMKSDRDARKSYNTTNSITEEWPLEEGVSI